MSKYVGTSLAYDVRPVDDDRSLDRHDSDARADATADLATT
jgi:hypothetical protein